MTNLDNRTHSAPHSKHEGDDDQLLADTDETTGLIEEDREGEEISRPQKVTYYYAQKNTEPGHS